MPRMRAELGPCPRELRNRSPSFLVCLIFYETMATFFDFVDVCPSVRRTESKEQFCSDSSAGTREMISVRRLNKIIMTFRTGCPRIVRLIQRKQTGRNESRRLPQHGGQVFVPDHEVKTRHQTHGGILVHQSQGTNNP